MSDHPYWPGENAGTPEKKPGPTPEEFRALVLGAEQAVAAQATYELELIEAGRREGYDIGWAEAIKLAARVAEAYEPRCDACPRGLNRAIGALIPPESKP